MSSQGCSGSVGNLFWARVFTQLADQRWVTVASAFIKDQGIGCCDQRQELAGGVSSGQKGQSLSHPLPKQRASQSESKRAKEKAMQEGASNSRGGGGLRACGETNPCPGSMTVSINFSTWCLSLPRWILRSRTDSAWHLRRSFSSMPQSNPVLCTTALPLPLPPLLASCWGSFSGLSKRRLSKLCRARLLHVLVLTLNYMHLGRFPTCDEAETFGLPVKDLPSTEVPDSCVSVWLFQRFVPAWAGPELSASLLQLENFLKVSPEFQGGYLDGPIDFKSDPAMFPAEDSPELVPYRCLDASRLRLVGSGMQLESGRFHPGALVVPGLGSALHT